LQYRYLSFLGKFKTHAYFQKTKRLLFKIRQQESIILPGLLANGALSLRGQRGEHDDDAVVARRALDKVPELVAVEPDDGALEGELAQLLHLLSEAAPAPALLLPAHRTPTTMFNRILYANLSFAVNISTSVPDL
jgi:hypothetical protein